MITERKKTISAVGSAAASGRYSATLEFGEFPVAIGCREAVKCPVKPPTRLCSRRDTVPETRQTKATSSFCVYSVNFELRPPRLTLTLVWIIP